MKITKVPFTSKFPFNYILVLDDGVSISTTDKAHHSRLVTYLEDHNITRFFDIKANRRIQLEGNFTIVKPRL